MNYYHLYRVIIRIVSKVNDYYFTTSRSNKTNETPFCRKLVKFY